MASLFTRIIRREIPSYTVAEDAQFMAFLDINPLTVGHTLVVPKQEIDHLFDYDNTTLSALIVFAKKLSISMRQCIPCKRIGMAVVGFEVPHAHMHLVPINTINDMNFSNPKLTLSPEEFSEIANKIHHGFQPTESPKK